MTISFLCEKNGGGAQASPPPQEKKSILQVLKNNYELLIKN